MALAFSARIFKTTVNTSFISSLLRQNAVRGLTTQKKPTKPVNGYFLYLNKIRPELTRNNPGKKLTELSAVASQMYKNLAPDEKQKLKYEADRLAIQYKTELEQWQNSLTEQDKMELANEKARTQMKRKQRKIRQISKEYNKPKRPLAPYILFNKEYHRMEAIVGQTDKTIIQLTKKSAELWRNMTDEEKKAYVDVYNKHKLQYEQELTNWEQSMFDKGQHSVIRKLHLKQMIGPKPRKMAKKRPTKVSKKAGVRGTKAANQKTGTKAGTKNSKK